MRSKTFITVDRCLALLLLCLFAVPLLAKALHAHEPTPHDHEQVVTAEHEEMQSSCATCDYQSPPLHQPTAVLFSLSVFENIAVLNSHYVSPPISSIGLCFSDRGPPAHI